LAGFLRRWLPADPHLWIAFVAAAVFLLTEILHWLPWFHVSEVSEMGVLIVIMISILTLVADRLKEADQSRENTERLGRVADYVSDLQGVSLRTRPSTPEEYESLWGGFTGNYYVYNPAYRVDEDTGEQEIVSILARRYQDPRFRKAQYLFLTKDVAGQKDLKTFCQLMTGVKHHCPDVVSKIQIKQMSNKAASSAPEMYLGTRRGEKVCILELKGPTLGATHGTSHHYLIIRDKKVIEHYLVDHFQLAWDDAAAENVKIWQ
jgi:hypothetical protein